MINVTEKEVKQLLAEGNKLVVDFSASWCGPCRTLTSILESIETSKQDVKFVKVNVDEERYYATEMGIRNLPTVMIYNGGNLKDRSSGVKSLNYYTEIIENL